MRNRVDTAVQQPLYSITITNLELRNYYQHSPGMSLTMHRLNIAFIGCGRIADLHYRGYRSHPHARIYAVCDTQPELAQKRLQEWGAVKIFTDYRELLLDPEIDAVEILTPHSDLLHEQIVVAAAAAGKHIAVQKPMTTSLKSADRMLSAVASSGRVFKVTENYLFYPPIQLARRMIESGEIGDPISLRIKFLSGSSGGWEVPAESWQWRMREVSEGRGTATFDHGHHLWSTAWYLLGEVERVSAWIDRSERMLDCPATVMWQYRAARRYGSADLTHCNNLHIPSDYYTNDEWIEVVGTRGMLKVNRCSAQIHTGSAVSIFDSSGWRHYDTESDWGLGFVGATQNFINAILHSEDPMLSGEQGREILRFALAVQRSSLHEREVYLDELDSRVPALYALGKKVKKMVRGFRLNIPSFLGEDTSKYAPESIPLTRKYLGSFDASAAADWDIVIGLHLTADGGIEEEHLAIIIRNGRLKLEFGQMPKDAKLRVRMPHGVWGAILLRKKRPEVAFLQGKIKVEGQVEEGLKLRELFKL